MSEKRQRNVVVDLRERGFFVRQIADEVELVIGNGDKVVMTLQQALSVGLVTDSAARGEVRP